MHFRQLTDKDIDFMRLHSLNSGFYMKMPCETEFNYALEYNEQILGIGGFSMINLFTYWAWFDMSDLAKDHIIICYRTIKEWMDIFAKEKSIRRIQAFIEVNNEAAARTAQHLGFELEYRMKHFYGDEPGDLYAKFFPEVK